MSLKFKNTYGVSVKKSFEDHTAQVSAYFTQEDQYLQHFNIDYKFAYGDGVVGAGLNIAEPLADERTFEKVVSYQHTFDDTTFGAEFKLKPEGDWQFEKRLWAKYVSDGVGFQGEVCVCPNGEAQFKPKLFYADDVRNYTAGFDFDGKLGWLGANMQVQQGPYGVKVNYNHDKKTKDVSGSWKYQSHLLQAGVQLDNANNSSVGLLWSYNF